MEKTKLMEDSMKKLDDEMTTSDQLLAQMIPKQVPPSGDPYNLN